MEKRCWSHSCRLTVTNISAFVLMQSFEAGSFPVVILSLWVIKSFVRNWGIKHYK